MPNGERALHEAIGVIPAAYGELRPALQFVGQAGDVVEGVREIDIGEHADRPGRGEQADPHGVPFTAVAAVTHNAESRVGGFEAQGFRSFGGSIGETVAHEDRFPRR